MPATKKALKKTTSKKVVTKNLALHQRMHHHAKRVYHLTPKFVHGMVAGAFVGVMLITGIRVTEQAGALSISSARDCDSNAVINCGALTTKELQTRYSQKGVATIYNHFGITATDIKNVGTTAVAGQVQKDGDVVVNGAVVATGAITAGRENISGSTKVTSGSTTFYKRAPSVSFRPNALSAFVIMENGQFKYAILGACGNPVSAKPVPKKTPPVQKPPVVTPVKTPPVETPPKTDVPVSTQTPESTPVVQTAAVTELPKTGPGSAVIIALLAILGGYLFHVTHRRVQRKRHSSF
jgi:hypothetical protein